ncbi:MAG: SAM-dependent methyltransferase [Chloroflexi bacterium]|nr:SAM-dependent methyltransferase [Chloroflexota bacterium]
MAEQGVGNTALGAAICRMIEQYQPEKIRLFDDPIAKELVGGTIRVLMQVSGMRNYTLKQTDGILPGIYGVQICRTRYIDDVVETSMSQGIDQVVILGAGLDTRPYRLPGIERVKAFEVDLPSVQETKKKKVEKYLGRLPQQVTYIPLDFDKQTLETAFAGTDFDPSSPAVFVWEGVTQYLSEDSVCQTLAFIGRSAPKSVLVFTYVLKSIVERRSNIPGAEKMLDTVAKNGAPWIFGLEPSEMQNFLAPFHLALVEDVGNADYQGRYLQPIGRNLVVAEIERIVQAKIN